MYTISYCFLIFLIISFLGWVMEVIDILVETNKLINRGFLIGPYCPIYGLASLCMIFLLKPFSNNLFFLFLMAILICSVFEYFVSFLMEKLFRARWWDYSDRFFNLNGRICLRNSIIFGVLAIVLLKYIYPTLHHFLIGIPPQILIGIALITFLIFLFDFIFSFNVIFRLKHTMDTITKDNTEEISKKVKSIILQKSFFFRRIFKAFPTYMNQIIFIIKKNVSKLK